MGNIHLVTGHAGKPHVTAADHGSLNAAIFGEGQYVLNRGSKFATTIISNNSIRVADGDIVMQGRHIRLDEGTYIDLVVENGSQGMYRNDLIVARYTKDSVSGVEDCNLVVIKGTAKSENATDPEYTSGDIINDHVLVAEMPLYRIPLDGLNVKTLVPLFEMRNSYGDAIKELDEAIMHFANIQNNLDSHKADTNNPHGVTAEQLGAMSMELLWENASPTSAFTAQTISVDANGFDWLAIEYYAIAEAYRKTQFCKVGGKCHLDAVTGSGGFAGTYVFNVWRQATSTAESVTFTEGRRSKKTSETTEHTQENVYVIPTRIYGIKGANA